MTAHSYSQWKLNDPIEDAPIEEISECIKLNRYSRPLAFAIMGTADQFVYNICSLLECHRSQVLTKELIETYFTADASVKEKVVSITMKVLKQLELLDVAQVSQQAQENTLDLESLYKGLKKHSVDGKIQIEIPQIDLPDFLKDSK